MSTEQNKAIIRRFWEAADRKDFEACGQILHPQFVAYGPGMEHLDAQTYRQLGEGFYAAFPDIKHTIEDQIAEADKVVTRMTLRGTLLRPDDAGYDGARRIWNGMIDRRPALIARCAGPADVIHAVNFTRTHNLLVAVRSGGHSFPGHSVCDTECHSLRTARDS